MNTGLNFSHRAACIAWSLLGAGLMMACEGPPGPPGPATTQPLVDAASDALADVAAEAASDAAEDAASDVSVAPAHVTTGPGLKLAISSAAVDGAGAVSVSFTVTDGAGTPLDYAGTFTDGPVTAKWVVGWLAHAGSAHDAGVPGSYTAYTTQVHRSPDGSKSAPLPDSDTGGVLTAIGVATGTYSYTFGTKLPAGYDATATHTVGVWATRVVGGQTYVVNTLYDFVPGGGAVTETRAVVTTQACNQCHNPLGYHEGNTARRDVGLCVICHAAPSVDVTNGNGLDLPTMIHKIHRGRYLPSVVAGGTYPLTEDELVSDAGADGTATVAVAVDHSGAWFPGEVQNCGMCHQGSQGATWKSVPSRAVCGACHDLTSFTYPPLAGYTLHSGGQQTADTTCLNAGCHGPADHYSVQAVHATASTDPAAPQLVLAIASVTSTQPGQTPVVHFTVTENGQPLDILATPLPSLAVTLAGPTTDYAQAEPLTYLIENGTAQPGLALDGVVGSYTFTLPVPVPASAEGSYAVGLEGYLQPLGPTGPTYAALNPVAYVAVTDATPVPRRAVVDRGKCNSCHYDLTAHGGTRKSPEYCVLCHTPNKVGDLRAPRFEVASTTAPSENFKVLVHRLHRGSQLAQGYVVGGFPAPTPANPGGTPVDFGKVRFPGDLRACWACHASTSYLPPLPDGLLATVMEENLLCADTPLVSTSYCSTRTTGASTVMSPIGAACTACHDGPAQVAHAQANTAPDGAEACLVCHGAGQTWDVQTVHVLPP